MVCMIVDFPGSSAVSATRHSGSEVNTAQVLTERGSSRVFLAVRKNGSSQAFNNLAEPLSRHLLPTKSPIPSERSSL